MIICIFKDSSTCPKIRDPDILPQWTNYFKKFSILYYRNPEKPYFRCVEATQLASGRWIFQVGVVFSLQKLGNIWKDGDVM